ncbi:MAG: DMT family transporter [Planctomycetota bacterium]
MSIRPRTLGYLLAFGSAAAGAMRYNLAVFARPRGFDYVPFLFYALAVGVACSAVHVVARDGFRGFVPLRGRWRQALLYGLLMAWGTLSHFLALEYMNETVMSSLAQTSILFTIALAVWLLGERFTFKEWIATGVICAGIFFFRPWDVDNLKGFAILMGGVLGAALATIGAKRWVEGVPPRVLMLWRNVVALAVVGTYTLLHYERPRITWETGLACVATGIVGPYLHGLFFLQALERIDAAKASLMNRVQPAIVFLLSWLLLDRLPGAREGWSALLLVVGTMGLVIARRRA